MNNNIIIVLIIILILIIFSTIYIVKRQTTNPSSTTQSSTTNPSSTSSSTTNPSTTNPSTTNPSSTNPSTTNPSTTNPSTTNPSTTNPSTTNPSTTNPSSTNPSSTTPPTNQDRLNNANADTLKLLQQEENEKAQKEIDRINQENAKKQAELDAKALADKLQQEANAKAELETLRQQKAELEAQVQRSKLQAEAEAAAKAEAERIRIETDKLKAEAEAQQLELKKIQDAKTLQEQAELQAQQVENNFINSLIRKFNKKNFGYGINVQGILSDKIEQRIYDKTLFIKKTLPIGSIIFFPIPIKKNEIGIFQLNGYSLLPLTNIENPITQKYAKYFVNKNIKTPIITNLKIKGNNLQTISNGDLQYNIVSNIQQINAIEHQHELLLSDIEQVHTRAQHQVAAWKPGAPQREIYRKSTLSNVYTENEGDNVFVDIRDKSNVFFFYMIIGYDNEYISVREPDDDILSKPLDSEYWSVEN